MAEEQEETQEQENETSQKKSSSLVLIIVIVVLIFTLIIGGIIVALLLSGDDDMSQQQSSSQQSQSMDYDDGGEQQPRRNNKATKRVIDLEVGPMFPLDGFTINLLSDSGRRYLKVTINLELKDEETATELEAKSPVIRDIMIRVLTSKTLEEIATAKGKDKLKDQLVNQINLRLQDGEIKNVYFVEFVIQ